MNLPNKLSLFRVVLVPVIVLLMIFPFSYFNIQIYEFHFGYASLSVINIGVLVLFLIASITDFFDGYYARKHNLITSFGKFIDPIADKLLVNSVFIILAVTNVIPVLPVLIMIWRDTIVDAIRLNAVNNGIVLAAGKLGKIKTVLQMITICLILLNNLPFELYRIPMDTFLLWFSTLISVLSGIVYFKQSGKSIMESK